MAGFGVTSEELPRVRQTDRRKPKHDELRVR
jgi:hypothetical protein